METSQKHAVIKRNLVPLVINLNTYENTAILGALAEAVKQMAENICNKLIIIRVQRVKPLCDYLDIYSLIHFCTAYKFLKFLYLIFFSEQDFTSKFSHHKGTNEVCRYITSLVSYAFSELLDGVRDSYIPNPHDEVLEVMLDECHANRAADIFVLEESSKGDIVL